MIEFLGFMDGILTYMPQLILRASFYNSSEDLLGDTKQTDFFRGLFEKEAINLEILMNDDKPNNLDYVTPIAKYFGT